MSESPRQQLLRALSLDCLTVHPEGQEQTLRGGGTSRFFIDVPALFKDVTTSQLLIQQLSGIVPEISRVQRLASPDFGGTFLAIGLQQYFQNHHKLSLHRFHKDGTFDEFPGGGAREWINLIVEDVVTTATSILPIVYEIKRVQNPPVFHAICVVNRQDGGGHKRLADMRCFLHSLFTLEEILHCRHILKGDV